MICTKAVTEAIMGFASAQLLIHFLMIYDIVAVLTAGGGLQVR